MKRIALDREERRFIKGQTALAVSDAGGQENAAEVSSRIKRHVSYSEYGNLQQPDRYVPIDVAIELDRFNGNGRFAQLLARLTGHLVVPMPEAGGGRLLDLTGLSAAQMGDLTREVIAAAADGKITDAEGRSLVDLIHQLMLRLAALATQVKAETERQEEKSR